MNEHERGFHSGYDAAIHDAGVEGSTARAELVDRGVIGTDTTLTKTTAYDWIHSVEATPNGANVAIRIHGTDDIDHVPSVQCAFVLLTKREARLLATRLLKMTQQ